MFPCPLLASLTDRLQKIEASKSGIEELLKRVMDSEKKLRERRRQSLIEVLNALWVAGCLAYSCWQVLSLYRSFKNSKVVGVASAISNQTHSDY